MADIELVAGWARQAGPKAAALALRQLDELLAVVEQSSARELHEVLAVLEAGGGGGSSVAAAQRELLALLDAFRSALVSVAELIED